jgi:hypothetical protein
MDCRVREEALRIAHNNELVRARDRSQRILRTNRLVEGAWRPRSDAGKPHRHLLNRLSEKTEARKMDDEPEHRINKRGRVGEGRPSKRTPEVVAKIAEAVATGLTDREAGLLAGVHHDTMTEWRKDPEFSER